MGSQRVIRVLFAGLFTTVEYCGNSVAQVEVRMALASRLSGLGELKVSNKVNTFSGGKCVKNQLFSFQT